MKGPSRIPELQPEGMDSGRIVGLGEVHQG